MDEVALNFIRSKNVDSFQKLRVLLFLHRNSNTPRTCQQLAEQLFISVPLLEKIIYDLQISGLLDCREHCYALRKEADLKKCLECLAGTFEDPVARQDLLDQIKTIQSTNRNEKNG